MEKWGNRISREGGGGGRMKIRWTDLGEGRLTLRLRHCSQVNASFLTSLAVDMRSGSSVGNDEDSVKGKEETGRRFC